MEADIKLDANTLSFDGDRVVVTAPDLEVNSAAHRTDGNNLRRALVHDAEDGLTINFGGVNGDYPAGVRINGAVMLSTSLNLNGNGVMSALVLREHLIMRRPGTDDLFLDVNFFQSLYGLLTGEPVVATIQLNDFETAPEAVVIGGAPIVLKKPLDLAEEIRRLRGDIRVLKARVLALEGK
jgi:hypothetical protein